MNRERSRERRRSLVKKDDWLAASCHLSASWLPCQERHGVCACFTSKEKERVGDRDVGSSSNAERNLVQTTQMEAAAHNPLFAVDCKNCCPISHIHKRKTQGPASDFGLFLFAFVLYIYKMFRSNIWDLSAFLSCQMRR